MIPTVATVGSTMIAVINLEMTVSASVTGSERQNKILLSLSVFSILVIAQGCSSAYDKHVQWQRIKPEAFAPTSPGIPVRTTAAGNRGNILKRRCDQFV